MLGSPFGGNMGQKTFKELFEAARQRPEYKRAMEKLEEEEKKKTA